MKCLVCSKEIDELKDFPTAKDPQGRVVEDTMGKLKHSLELAKWTHVSLTAQKAAGAASLLSGHVCPAHNVEPGCLGLVSLDQVASPKGAAQATTPKGKD